MANLPGEATYTNNTSNAQIQISPFEYNLGAQGSGGRWKGEGRRKAWLCLRGEGERSLPISQLTQTNGTIWTRTRLQGGPGPFETARVPNVPKPLAIVLWFSAGLFLVIFPSAAPLTVARSCRIVRFVRQGGQIFAFLLNVPLFSRGTLSLSQRTQLDISEKIWKCAVRAITTAFYNAYLRTRSTTDLFGEINLCSIRRTRETGNFKRRIKRILVRNYLVCSIKRFIEIFWNKGKETFNAKNR